MADDPKKVKKPKTGWENWDGMVEKADGSIGKWGNDIPADRYKKAKVRLAPGHGEMDKSKIDSLIKAGRGGLIGPGTQKPGQMASYGPEATDIIKKLVKSK